MKKKEADKIVNEKIKKYNLIEFSMRVLCFLGGMATFLLVFSYFGVLLPQEKSCYYSEHNITNVSQGGINVNFLMDKLEDRQEIYAFCVNKGYDNKNGIQSGNEITCFKYRNGETILKSFDIIDDYAVYLIDKYGG